MVAPQDLELYDRLVLHREREANQAWHGGLGVMHPQGHCNHSSTVIHDVGNTVPATVNPSSTIPENVASIVVWCGVCVIPLLNLNLIQEKHVKFLQNQ